MSELKFKDLSGRELRITTPKGTEIRLQVIRPEYNHTPFPVCLIVQVLKIGEEDGLFNDQEVEFFATNEPGITREDLLVEADAVALYAVDTVAPGYVCMLRVAKIVGFEVRTVEVL